MAKKREQPVIGRKYNHLKVIERGPNYISPKGIEFSQWVCECDCNKRVLVLGSSLMTGHTKSCGCLSKRPKVSDESMIGRYFGLLKVVARAPSHKVPSGAVYDMWHCVCKCGNTTVSFGRNLRSGRTSSCGCNRVVQQAKAKWTPKAETWTKSYLDDHGIGYIYQHTFPDLTGPNGGLLSYDFWLAESQVLLELNGLQHYEPIDWFGGEATFEKQIANDEAKRQYAEDHGYKLIVIDTDHISEKKLKSQLDKMLFEI